MQNKSGIHPYFSNVLIEPIEVETKTASGIVLATLGQKDREEMANTTAVLIELGPDCLTGQFKVGDRVIFGKYSGLLYLGKDGKKYRIIKEDNLVGSIDSDVSVIDPFLAKGLQ